jgi:hypothetical protein
MQATTNGHMVSPNVTQVDPPSHVKAHDQKGHEAIEMRWPGPRLSASDFRAASISSSDLKGGTKRQRLLAKVQFATVCFTMYLAGWNDGTTGPLLPRIQEVYHVGGFDPCSISEIDLSSQ